MNILCLYNSAQTYTNTVYEHLSSFVKYSDFSWHYLHWSKVNNIDLGSYDVIVLHYSVRLPLNQVDNKICDVLKNALALKVLFIQDEYDHTNLSKFYIKKIGFDLVFSTVPEKSLDYIYPSLEFSKTRFVTNLTGYVPEELQESIQTDLEPPSKRTIIIGYRGRPLPIRYGQLGFEKVQIGKTIKKFCKKFGITHDIEWHEESRKYGLEWYKFLSQCRAMLGSESGSNVFDFDGDLDRKVRLFRYFHPFASQATIYEKVIKPLEIKGAMNQVSPRIFEMAVSKVVMILLEGEYSGVLYKDKHFIPLKKDYSNMQEIFAKLNDQSYIDRMVNAVYEDIILSEKYSYKNFVKFVDNEISKAFFIKHPHSKAKSFNIEGDVTKFPIRTAPPPMSNINFLPYIITGKIIRKIWVVLPEDIRSILRKHLLQRRL